MEWLIIIGASFVVLFLLKKWTHYQYYEGLKAGMMIGEGVSRGQDIHELGRRYDRYNNSLL